MRIYAYGARPPIANAQLVYDQFRLAHSYQCALISIERKRRETVDWLYIHACPAEAAAYDRASRESQAASEAVRQSRGKYKGDMLEPDEDMSKEDRVLFKVLRDNLLAAREAEKVARQAWYDARKKATPKLKPRMQMCDRGAKARNKRAYNLAGTVGLVWGTRLKIGESVERAAKASAQEGSLPKFPKFDGGGMLAVQLQGESGLEDKKGLLPVDALSNTDTRFRLELVDDDGVERIGNDGKPLPRAKPGSRRSGRKRMLVHLRVGSDGRTPIWATWPVSLHRPMPEAAVIKWAQMIATKIGPRTEWRLLVTIDDETPVQKPRGTTLAVNLGWRNLLDGGLRVAYAVDSNGREEEIRVPPAYPSGVAHVDSIRSIRDRLFEAAKSALKSWLADEDHPVWLDEATRWAEQWRSPKKLVFLLRDWEKQRFSGDESMWTTLIAWRKKDRHLWFWECDRREGLLRMRKDFYRVTAARWADVYTRIIVTDMDLRDFAELLPPEEGAANDGGLQRRSRMLAAPSELRGAIKNACSTRGTSYEEVEGAFKTQTCNACGVVMMFPAKTFLENTCSACGEKWDQDSNHARNLLASDEVMHKKRGSLAPSVSAKETAAEKKTGRWQKRRAKPVVENVEVAVEKS